MRIEVQVLRDVRAFSRPVTVEILDNVGTRLVLPPGWGADYMPVIEVEIGAMMPMTGAWRGFQVDLWVDSMPMGTPRPGVMYCEPTDVPSGLVQFPAAADPASATLGGWHTVTLRCVTA